MKADRILQQIPWKRLLLAALLLAVPAAVRAQSQATMAGAVTTGDGSPAPGVKVRLEASDGQGASVEATSNKKGRYLIGLIRPGGYVLRVDTQSDAVVLRVRGKGTGGETGRSVLWEIDQAVSAEQPAKLNVGPRNQLELDITVGPKATTPPPIAQGEGNATQDAFAVGVARVRDGKFTEALEVLEPLSQKAPDQANVWYLLGFSRERLRKFDDALPAADRALSIDPSLPGAHLLRARILTGLKRPVDAEPEFRKEIERGSNPSLVLESWVGLSKALTDAKRPDDAIAALERASELDPSQAEVFLDLARRYAAAGSPDKAAGALERAEKAGAKDDASVVNLAITFLNQKEYDRAESIARRLLEKGSEDANLAIAHSVLARCELNRGKTREAIPHLEAALALDSTSSLAGENRSILAAVKK